MRVLVIGSTGMLGGNVAPRLVENGHEVRALVRRHESTELNVFPMVESAAAEEDFPKRPAGSFGLVDD